MGALILKLVPGEGALPLRLGSGERFPVWGQVCIGSERYLEEIEAERA